MTDARLQAIRQLQWRMFLSEDEAESAIENLADPAYAADTVRDIIDAGIAIDELLAALAAQTAALQEIQANRESAERGDACRLAACSRCAEKIGWPVQNPDPPICEDCLIRAALLSPEPARAETQE